MSKLLQADQTFVIYLSSSKIRIFYYLQININKIILIKIILTYSGPVLEWTYFCDCKIYSCLRLVCPLFMGVNAAKERIQLNFLGERWEKCTLTLIRNEQITLHFFEHRGNITTAFASIVIILSLLIWNSRLLSTPACLYY